jgi:UDP-N-acetylmuramoylalanine--D-glutamate ligase
LSVGSILAIDKKTCAKVFKNFKGLPHRMEEVATVNGVTFINDSKATTAEACLWALQSLAAPVILIAGGKDKGVDYGIIRDACRNKVKRAILIGEAKQKLRGCLDGVVALSESETLQDAVRQGFSKASPGDAVVLSPMCSSFDMFSDYQQRGEVFKQSVAELVRENQKNNGNA